MKVSTDACLFGAIMSLEDNQTILDIGTGTGLLSLMAAQRSHGDITAVELDADAAQQAQDNFLNSPWADRIHIQQQSIQDYADSCKERFDNIICNPPFFTAHFPSEDPKRHQARHNDTLSFRELGSAVSRLLTAEGLFQILLPTSEQDRFQRETLHTGLHLVKRINIKPTLQKAVSRMILTFSRYRSTLEEQEVCIHSPNGYTEGFTNLLKPFYLRQ